MLSMLNIWRLSALLTVLTSFSIASAKESQEIIADNARQSSDSLLWGPYKPNLYFGVRPRIPKSLTAGLIWAKVDNFTGIQQSMITQGVIGRVVSAFARLHCNTIG